MYVPLRFDALSKTFNINASIFRDASFITASDIMVDGGYCALGAEGHNASVFAGTSSPEEKK